MAWRCHSCHCQAQADAEAPLQKPIIIDAFANYISITFSQVAEALPDVGATFLTDVGLFDSSDRLVGFWVVG